MLEGRSFPQPCAGKCTHAHLLPDPPHPTAAPLSSVDGVACPSPPLLHPCLNWGQGHCHHHPRCYRPRSPSPTNSTPTIDHATHPNGSILYYPTPNQRRKTPPILSNLLFTTARSVSSHSLPLKPPQLPSPPLQHVGLGASSCNI